MSRSGMPDCISVPFVEVHFCIYIYIYIYSYISLANNNITTAVLCLLLSSVDLLGVGLK